MLSQLAKPQHSNECQLSINCGLPTSLSGHHNLSAEKIHWERRGGRSTRRRERSKHVSCIFSLVRSSLDRATPPTHSKDRQVAAVFCIVARRHHSCFSLSMKRRLSHTICRGLCNHLILWLEACPLFALCGMSVFALNMRGRKRYHAADRLSFKPCHD